MRAHLIDLYVKSFDLSEEARDHGLGSVEVTEGERWFHNYTEAVVEALGSVMTPEELKVAERRLF